MSAVASLWPEINVDIVPPATVLRIQAAALSRLTKGMLDAEVTTVNGVEDYISLRLDLIAPALDDRRERILTVTHRATFYPLVLEAECFRSDRILMPVAIAADAFRKSRWYDPKDGQVAVMNYDDFLKRLEEVLKSGPVRSAIDSLLALSNERAAELRTEPAEPAA
jgi:hypothetical protein